MSYTLKTSIKLPCVVECTVDSHYYVDSLWRYFAYYVIA